MYQALYLFLFSHLLLWTLVPTLSNTNLPLDTIEALAWGSNLDWGFNKHPPLSALAVEIFYQIFALFHVVKLPIVGIKKFEKYNRF